MASHTARPSATSLVTSTICSTARTTAAPMTLYLGVLAQRSCWRRSARPRTTGRRCWRARASVGARDEHAFYQSKVPGCQAQVRDAQQGSHVCSLYALLFTNFCTTKFSGRRGRFTTDYCTWYGRCGHTCDTLSVTEGAKTHHSKCQTANCEMPNALSLKCEFRISDLVEIRNSVTESVCRLATLVYHPVLAWSPWGRGSW